MINKALSILFILSVANSYVFVGSTPYGQGFRERISLQELRSRYYNQDQPDNFIKRLIAEKTGFISNLYGQDYDNAYSNYMSQIYNVPTSPTQPSFSYSHQPQKGYQSSEIYETTQSPQIQEYEQEIQEPLAIEPTVISSNVFAPSSNILSNVFVGERGIGIQNVPGIHQYLNNGGENY